MDSLSLIEFIKFSIFHRSSVPIQKDLLFSNNLLSNIDYASENHLSNDYYVFDGFQNRRNTNMTETWNKKKSENLLNIGWAHGGKRAKTGQGQANSVLKMDMKARGKYLTF